MDFSNRLEKKERLTSRREIDQLFHDGHSFYEGQFKVYWATADIDQPTSIQLLISIPRKNLQRAVDRNRMKRLVREAYRKNKHGLQGFLEQANKKLKIALVFLGKRTLKHAIAEPIIILILQRLIRENEKTAG